MIKKDLEKIDIKDIERLIENSVSESRTIEYKSQMHENNDSAKKEFLADVSSFANSAGGDLIYGIAESKGIPTSIIGIATDNIDKLIIKLDEQIMYGIEPRIQVAIHHIKTDDSKFIIIIRIKKSWLSPHRVCFKGGNKFYSRKSANKYEMDVNELRTAFNLSNTIIEKIRNFQLDRISKIFNNDTPIKFEGEAKVILHLIPISSFELGNSMDFKEINTVLEKLLPIYSSGRDERINLDGLLKYSKNTYIQIYRNGIIEAVTSSMLHQDSKLIAHKAFEEEIIKSLESYLDVMKNIDIMPPIAVFLTLTGIKGYRVTDGSRFCNEREEVYPIDRDILQLPEALVESYDIKPESVLKPMFDLIWNACGFECSQNFDANGNFIKR
jgi:predicted HTH transcriptional regulator